MRKDFKKVLCECIKEGAGRATSSKAIRTRVKASKKDEDGEFYGRTNHNKLRLNTKDPGENLRPLERWIHKQVGRPWDKVYSEISAQNPKESAVGIHIFQHLYDYIYVHVDIVEESGVKRVIRRDTGFRSRYHGLELHKGDLYVDPNDNIIKVYKRNKQVGWWNTPKKPVEGFVQIDDSTSLNRVDGQWYLIGWEDFPPDRRSVTWHDKKKRYQEGTAEPVWKRDILLNDSINRNSRFSRWEKHDVDWRTRIRGKWAKTKQQANKKLLKKHGVR